MQNEYDKSVEGICDFIWDLEKKFDLFSKSEQDVFFWQLIRFRLYYEITQKTGVFGAPQGEIRRSASTLFYMGLKITESFLFHNPFLSKTEYKNIVMPTSRQVNGVDIYTEELIKNLNTDETLTLYEKNVPENDAGSKNLMAMTYFNHILALINKGSLSNETKALLINIEDLITKTWGITINLQRNCLLRINRFKRDTKTYQKIFKQTKSKKLYLVVAYLNQPIIHAAHLCGMKVIELQHGTFTKYHLGYSYPIDGDKISYFPDEILTFGKFWSDHTPLPIHTKTTVIGAPYVQRIKDNVQGYSKDKNLIVFSSQGAIAKDLFPFAMEAAKLMPDYKFIYRLHPNESLHSFEDALTNKTLRNFSLSHKTPNIFELLAQAEYQAGVFSTTLLEGMALSTKVILINMPGIEYMKPVIDAGDSTLVNTPHEFKNEISNLKKSQNATYYYANPVIKFKDILGCGLNSTNI